MAEAAAKASISAASDKAKIVRLEAEVARLNEALRVSEARVQEVAKTAALEASQHAAEKMLQRYRDGLRDGATLSRGSFSGLSSSIGASSTPDSAAHTRDSPSFSWSAAI